MFLDQGWAESISCGCVVRIVREFDSAHNELIYFVRMTQHQLNP